MTTCALPPTGTAPGNVIDGKFSTIAVLVAKFERTLTPEVTDTSWPLKPKLHAPEPRYLPTCVLPWYGALQTPRGELSTSVPASYTCVVPLSGAALSSNVGIEYVPVKNSPPPNGTSQL